MPFIPFESENLKILPKQKNWVIGISRDGGLYVVFVFGEAKNKHHIYTLSR